MVRRLLSKKGRPKYYLKEQTSAIARLWREKVWHQRPLPDFPTDAQIQTITGCNARCIFCPAGKTKRRIIPGQKMPEKLYYKIIDELLDRGITRISPYLMNEPLLDKRLPELIYYITQRKSNNTFTKLNTNGALLTEDMAKGILDSGLDRLNFSVHGIVPEIYEKTMVGLKLDVVLRNIDRFLELKRNGNYKKPRVRVTMVKTRVLEPQIPRILAYWGERGVKVNLQPLENRVNKQIENQKLELREFEPFTWCNRMFEQVYILADGRLVLCCVDWEQTTIMGDLREQTLYEIWHSEKYRRYRQRFLAGELDGMLCAGCKKELA
ncbi:radical SAM protein [Candidatus Sumerlaeota bacterium]|nr:radical SAM protein [Candidatus Sumerlaeota bacterium]